MASLAGATIATTYRSLLKLAGNTDDLLAGGSAARQIQTGDGEATILYLNSDRIGIGTSSPAVPFHVVGELNVGVDNTGHDVKFFGATSGQYMLWDESADELVLALDSKLSFHDAAGGENIIATSDGHLEINSGTTLDITAPTVDINASSLVQVDGPISVGIDGTGYDVTFFGDSAGKKLLWDESADELALIGANTKLSFFDAAGGENMYASGDGVLLINSGTSLTVTTPTTNIDSSTKIQLNSPTIDIGEDDASDITINLLGSTNDYAIEYDESVKKLNFGGHVIFDGANKRVGINCVPGAISTGYSGLDQGLYIRGESTSDDGSAGLLVLENARWTGAAYEVVDGTKIGMIVFQAPVETGTDATKACASIWAEADGSFGATSNDTDLVFATGLSEAATEKMRVASNGHVGFGVEDPQNIIHASVANGNDDTFIARLDNADTDEPLGIDIRFTGITSGTGTDGNDYYIVARDMSGGSLTTRLRIDGEGDVETVSGDDIAQISDERLKENIADYTGGLAIINALKPRTFTWKNNVDRGQTGTRYGFIAQEIMNATGYQENMRLAKKGKIHDETDLDAIKALCGDGVLYKSQLSAKECILISAIKELSAKVTALESA